MKLSASSSTSSSRPLDGRSRIGSASGGRGGCLQSAPLLSSRPPVLLQFSAHHTVAAGFVGAVNPKHIVELPAVANPMQSSSCTTRSNGNSTAPSTRNLAEEYFHQYAAPLERVVHLLGAGGSSNSSGLTNTSSNNVRRVVVVHSHGLHLERFWKLAISRILCDVLNFSSCSFQSALQMLPFALTTAPAMSPTSSSLEQSAPQVLLTVFVSANEAQCMVYAAGHLLEYTFQSCGYDDHETTPMGLHQLQQQKQNEQSIHDTVSPTLRRSQKIGELRKLQMAWLSPIEGDEKITRNHHVHNLALIRLVCTSLLSCPLALRKRAIQNILVAGTVLVDDFAIQLAKKLFSFLTLNDDDVRKSSAPSSEQRTSESGIIADDDADNDDDTALTAATASSLNISTVHASENAIYTEIPLTRKMLRPLAEHVAVVAYGSRSELMPWLGASIWGFYWHQQEQECGTLVEQFQWQDLVVASSNK